MVRGVEAVRAGEFVGYFPACILSGVNLPISASHRGYQAPAAGVRLFNARSFLTGAVELSLFFGVSLLVGIFLKLVWLLTFPFFAGLRCLHLRVAMTAPAYSSLSTDTEETRHVPFQQPSFLSPFFTPRRAA